MSLKVFERLGRPSTRVVSFMLAIVSPLVSAGITEHFAVLRALPYALSFVATVCVATYGGLLPGLLCVFLSVVLQQIFLPTAVVLWPLEATAIARPAALIVSAVAISILTRSRRRTSEALASALDALREQSAALIESQQASKCASWTYDSRDRTRWFGGGYEVFGIPFAEIEELPSLLDLVLPEDREAVRGAVRAMIVDHASLHIEYRTRWPNGEVHWSEARGNPLSGNPYVWRGVTFDITERKLAEAALIRSEKLAAMGRLASTVAHEINNPLEAVTNLLYLARSDRSLQPETEEHLAIAEKEVARLGNITRLTLGFVRTTTARSDVDMAAVFEDVLSIFNHQLLMKSIRVERHFQTGVFIEIAPHELRQVATNLISNAADALSGSGSCIRVRVERSNSNALLFVEDNGSGIAATHIERIFDPFFSTKEDVGTGIGLWVTKELVEKCGGRIFVESGVLGDGFRTRFRVEIPISGALPMQAENSGARSVSRAPVS